MSLFLPPPYVIAKLLFFPVFSRAASLGLCAAKQIQLEFKKKKSLTPLKHAGKDTFSGRVQKFLYFSPL